MSQPQILSLNLDHSIVTSLEEKKYDIYEGNLGNLIKLDIGYNSYVNCRLQHNIPANFHEYDVIIIDLTNETISSYNEKDHKTTFNKTGTTYYLRCHHPQTIFDPRPYSLSTITLKINELMKRPCILLVFAAEQEEVQYNLTSSSSYEEEKVKRSNYSFSLFAPIDKNKNGFKTVVPDGNYDIYNLLRRYQDGTSYDITFFHPLAHTDKGNLKDPSFYPVIYNNQTEIVGFLKKFDSGAITIFLPKIKEKGAFLEDFLDEIAPGYVPSIFPNNKRNSWIDEPKYYLPNHAKLIKKKEDLLANYQDSLNKIELEIEENTANFEWLNEILYQTDSELVSAVIKFLEWLEFKQVKDCDNANKTGVKEEDIQIETSDGLIILEVKGIGGTSKDTDCSQIGKIKARRIQQGKRFDVFGIYIVNHQRHLPPHERKNPPFTDHQKSDALYDERALMTTWQLREIYHLIEKGILTKQQVRDQFYNYGFIDFIPKSYINVGTPIELLKNNSVVVIDLPQEVSFFENEDIFVCHGDDYRKIKIKSIQVEGESVKSAKGVKVGLLLAQSVSKNSVIYKIS